MPPLHTSGRTSSDGMVLFAVLAVLAALALLCGTAFLITSTDMRITHRYQQSAGAFHTADSGVQYVKSLIEADLAAGRITLTNAEISVYYAPPAGYTFAAVTSLTRVAVGENPCHMYRIVSTVEEARASIEVSFQRRPAMAMGVFGDSAIETKNGGNIYSYYSDRILNPVPSNSTSEADSGSNESVTTHVGSFIDGDLLLGADAYGNAGHWADPGDGSIIIGLEGSQVGRVNPDPLGLVGGALAADFLDVATANNNATANPPIIGNRINLGAGETMTLPPGDYYVTEVSLGNGATLTASTTGGTVHIYLNGRFDLRNSATINNTGRPTDLSIFCKTSDRIQFYNSSAFRGLLYAPLAEVNLLHMGDFLGVIWADDVEIKNSGDVWIDVSILNRVLSNKIRLLTWKEAR